MKKSKAKTKKAKGAWFYKKRGSYLPCSWQGLLIYLVYTAYVITLPVVWYYDGHDVGQLLTFIIPLMCVAALLTQYVASKSSH